jgi:peptidoglycan hydrolase-like protein with peptidoglycan-binding domain
VALQSQLFRGDPKLEAAALSDQAHVTPGAVGPHVSKVQQALIELDGARIDQDGVYGPATAAAVLAYKRHRNIVNRSYQTDADNIVGKMTIVALDQEMQDNESAFSDLVRYEPHHLWRPVPPKKVAS